MNDTSGIPLVNRHIKKGANIVPSFKAWKTILYVESIEYLTDLWISVLI